MKQSTKKTRSIKKNKTVIKSRKVSNRSTSKHQQYGTSKLEQDFALNFLDKLNVEYDYQYEAKSIKRFYDFYLPKENLLIEVDGDYW